MALITVRRRTHGPGEAPANLGAVPSAAGWCLVALASGAAAWLVWRHLGGAATPGLGIAAFLERGQVLPLSLLGLATPPILFPGLRLARVLERQSWMVLWATLAPWPLLGLTWLLESAYLVAALLLPLAWAGLSL